MTGPSCDIGDSPLYERGLLMTKRNICLVFLVLLALFNGMQALAGPLHEAADQGNVGSVKTVIREGTDINERDRGGRTALMFSVNSGNKELVKLLIEKGADVNAKDNHGGTALIWAAGMDNLEIVRLLLEHGADVNARGGRETALVNAAGRGHPEIVKFLIDRGGRIRSRRGGGR